MSAKTQTVELDQATASMLEARAAECGLSVAELVAEMTALQNAPAILPSEEIAELDRQWAAVKAGEATVPHEHIVRWLQTWGTPAFKRWHDR